MDCPDCGAEVVAFPVPEELREHAPGEGTAAAICTRCLSLTAADGADSDPDLSRIIEAFPGSEAGAATALAVGLLVESLALNRPAIAELLGYAVDRGVDPWLVLERLEIAPTVRADADLGRLRRQLDQLVG